MPIGDPYRLYQSSQVFAPHSHLLRFLLHFWHFYFFHFWKSSLGNCLVLPNRSYAPDGPYFSALFDILVDTIHYVIKKLHGTENLIRCIFRLLLQDKVQVKQLFSLFSNRKSIKYAQFVRNIDQNTNSKHIFKFQSNRYNIIDAVLKQ